MTSLAGMEQLAAMAQEYPILAKIPVADLLPLHDFVVQRGDMSAPWRVAPAFYIGLLIMWLLCKLLRSVAFPALLGRSEWAKHSSEHQRTMVIYVLQIVLTTTALVLQLASMGAYTFRFTVAEAKCIFAANNLVVLLYAVELLYRESLRWQMAAHHILTIAIITIAMIFMYRNDDPSLLLFGNAMLFQATTEQFTFVGLLGYRLKWRPSLVQGALLFSAFQSLLCKLISVGASVWIWSQFQRPTEAYTALGRAWTAVFWIVMSGLLVTQVYGTYVIVLVARGYKRRYAESAKAADVEAAAAVDAALELEMEDAANKSSADFSSKVTSRAVSPLAYIRALDA